MTARTITTLRKNHHAGGGSSLVSSSPSSTAFSLFNLRILVYVAMGLVLVCAMSLIRMTLNISEATSVQQAVVAKSASASWNSRDGGTSMMMSRGGGGDDGDDGDSRGGQRRDIGGEEQEEDDLDEEEEEEGEGEDENSNINKDVYDERGDEEGDDMHLANAGGMFDIQNVNPPVLPNNLPPLPQGAGSLDERIWQEKNGTYPFKGTAGCAAATATGSTTATRSATSCLVHFPLPPNATNRKCPQSCLRTLKGQKFADMTNQNQDRSLLLQPLFFQNQPPPPPKQQAGNAANQNFLILLADGHGNTGHHTAEQVARDLPFRILQSLEQLPALPPASTIRGGSSSSNTDAVISILTQDFLAADVEAVKTPGGGTTGIIALKLGPSSLYLAQAGDSFAFVVQYNKKSKTASIVMKAIRHKPADPLERQRIELAGGQVMLPPFGLVGGTSRVVIPDPNGGMLAEALAMSRSLGDDNGKKLGLLTAEPSVVHVDLEQLKKDGNCGSSSPSTNNNCEQFLVVSSDGVLDYFSPQEVADFVAFKLYQKQPPVALEQVMAQALDMAARRWNMQMNMGGYRDDMTLVISKL